MKITAKQVAKILNITRQQVTSLVREGKLKANFLNDKKRSWYRFEIEEVYKFLNERNKIHSEKICTKCKEVKQLSEFGINKKIKDGHRSQCKICESESNKEYSLRNRDKILAYQKEWYQKNKEVKKTQYLKDKDEISFRRKKQYQENRDIIRIRQKEKYNTDPKYKEKVLKETAEYRKNNREKINEKMRIYQKSEEYKKKQKEYRERDYVKIKSYKNNRKYYEKNTDRIKQQAIDWGNKNPDKVAFYEAIRRAKKKGQSIEGIPVNRDEIIKRDNATCYICGKGPLEKINIHLDHVIPLSKGGLHIPENLKVTCISCNCKKQEKTIEEVKFLIDNKLW